MTKKEFLSKLESLNLSISEFSDMLGLNIGSVYSWNDTNRKILSWVDVFLFHYEKSLKFDKIQSLLKDG